MLYCRFSTDFCFDIFALELFGFVVIVSWYCTCIHWIGKYLVESCPATRETCQPDGGTHVELESISQKYIIYDKFSVKLPVFVVNHKFECKSKIHHFFFRFSSFGFWLRSVSVQAVVYRTIFHGMNFIGGTLPSAFGSFVRFGTESKWLCRCSWIIGWISLRGLPNDFLIEIFTRAVTWIDGMSHIDHILHLGGRIECGEKQYSLRVIFKEELLNGQWPLWNSGLFPINSSQQNGSHVLFMFHKSHRK